MVLSGGCRRVDDRVSMVDAGEEGRVRGGQFGLVSAWQMSVVSVLVLVLGQWLVGMCAVYPVA